LYEKSMVNNLGKNLGLCCYILKVFYPDKNWRF
jgi:hypothetical protein